MELEDPQEDSVLASIPFGYFEALAKIVGRTKLGYSDFLKLNALSDGYVADFLHDWTEFLFESDRARFTAVVRALSDEERRRVCGECRILKEKALKVLE